ncbi:hypothetical protein E3N88_22701 [Mikania micrantha]|uniref:CCHC-type domain-containing protein n=1 Tax=Mikania micrantha TaxID=192012 RepID=A0A5N6NCW9_9ASTR|nr:hypothetical protein E3N88_22701 [Mikania micrantha]
MSIQCPVLSSTNYTVWAMRMRVIFNVHGVWEMIEPGTNLDARKNNIAIALLFQAMSEEQILQIGNLQTAKEMWGVLKNHHLGADRIREARLQTLMREFENLKMKDQEQVVDLKTIGYDDVVGRLKAYEERIKDEETQTEQNQLLFTRLDEKAAEKGHKCEHCGCESSNRDDFGPGQGRGRGSGRGRGVGEQVPRNKSRIRCYKCGELGHYLSECPSWEEKKEKVNLNQVDEDHIPLL